MSNCVNKGCAAYKGPCLNDMPGVVCYGFMPPITNYDRIISKTPEELAEWLINYVCSNAAPYANARGATYKGKLIDWLKQEVE